MHSQGGEGMNARQTLDSDQCDEQQPTATRRAVLRRTATGAVGAAGATLVSGSATAQSSVSVLDIRESVPGQSVAPQGEDEIVLYVHGWQGTRNAAGQAGSLKDTMRANGYDQPVIGVKWRAKHLIPSESVQAAAEDATRLADWLTTYIETNPETNIRTVGHSMGGIVTAEYLKELDGDVVVDTASMIGAYIDANSVCEGNEYHATMENSAAEVYNYYSTNDSIAKIGSTGASCDPAATPDTYTDVDVSESVGGHTAYKSSDGCVTKIIEDFTADVDRDGGGGDGSDDGDNGSDDGDTGSGDSGNEESEDCWLLCDLF
jgi:pimeloyl-ACP methyl ester carboxylesterase